MKKKIISHLCLFCAVVSLAFVLYCIFATDATMADGLVIGKVCMFHKAMLALGGTIFLTSLLQFALPAKKYVKSLNINDVLPDICIFLFVIITLISYDWKLNPEPDKLLFGGQIVIMWFMIRMVLNVSAFKYLPACLLMMIMLTGIAESVLGMGQLYGFFNSTHSLFNLTGSFYNPGPYSGFLAVLLPLCVGALKPLKSYCKRWLKPQCYLYWTACITIVMILVVLPAGMSRSAWVAAIVSCAFVLWYQNREVFSIYFKKHKTMVISIIVIACILLPCAGAGLYMMKKDSADGRLLLWKITAKTILKQPLTGTGLGGFPAAYAETQAEYFASGKASAQEKLVAGCPEYAFNEYLQTGTEQGIIAMLAFIVFFILCIRKGLQKGNAGAAGGMLSLAIFAISSYPLQLPSFWIILVLLGTLCLADNNFGNAMCDKSRHINKFIYSVIAILLITGTCSIFYMQKGTETRYKEWNKLKMLYESKAYKAVADDYTALYSQLLYRPEFLFEGAQCLGKTGHYKEAIQWLERAERLSGDSMIRYMRAKNEQMLGNYEKAEQILLHSIDILPERIYPYYLLAKLYAEPAFYQPDKFDMAAEAVFTKQPKVESTAIHEMREEIQKLKLEKNKVINR